MGGVVVCRDVQLVLLPPHKIGVKQDFGIFYLYSQGCSHAFDIGGAQASKIMLGSFCLKYWGGPNPTFTIV